MKKLSPIVLALALTACSSIPNPISPKSLAAIEASYGAAEAVAVSYRDQCAKRLLPPSCRTVTAKLRLYGGNAQVAILRARAFVKKNPNVSAVTVLVEAESAVAAFAAQANGVK